MTRNTAIVLVCFVISSALFVHKASEAQSQQSSFLLTVETTSTGVNMVCHRGCAWETLTFECGRLPCSSGIDASGMTDAP